MRRTISYMLLLLGSMPAVAQQTANNVVTQSEDAFGRTVGNERIGIYSQDEVRGFNPSEAGNTRLEGLYFDQGGNNPPRLLDGSSIKVGYAARGTFFPAPTGIVDNRMEKFTGDTKASAELEVESYANFSAVIEAKIALSGDKLGLALGLGMRESDQVQFRNGSIRNYLAGVSWLPDKDSEFILFTSGVAARGAEATPSIFPAGSALPPEQPRKLQQIQPWALNRFRGSSSGLIVKMPFAGMKLEAGLFRSTRDEPERFITLFERVQSTGQIGNHLVIAEQDNRVAVIAGEVRLSRIWNGENLRHTLVASVRGRDQKRDYGHFGPQNRASFGASLAGIQDIRLKPAFAFGAKDHSELRQMTYGMQYNLLTRGGSTLSLTIQRANYRKSVEFANPATPDSNARDTPWLFSANGSVAIAPGLTAYGGYIRGLEESANAPDNAINRGEAPPALRTKQMDLGLRYALTPRLSLIAGLFEVKKPYYAVDAALRYGNLGTVSNRGVELSLAGTLTKGLTVVAGAILIDPKISGVEVQTGRIGPRPVGSFKQRAIFNLDWKPVGQEAWSFDVATEIVSSEMADRLNTFSAPAKTNINLGARYRFAMGSTQFLIRAQVQNLLDSYGWRVNPSGSLAFNPPRTGVLQVVADF